MIFGAANGDKIFAMTEFMLAPIAQALAWGMALLIVVLLMTFLVTSADSAVLIVNTINAAGDEGPKARPHIMFWGAALALVVGGLLISGGYICDPNSDGDRRATILGGDGVDVHCSDQSDL